MSWVISSALPGVHWPGVPGPSPAGALALLFQLQRSERMKPEQLRETQRRQLDLLLKHAQDSVPFYRERWGTTPPSFGELPLLTRRDLQTRFDDLKSTALPREHGETRERRTSGSTGAPVRTLTTVLCGLLWNAITLRDHRWHRRDLNGTLAIIRRGAGRRTSASWGPATEGLVETGPSVSLDVDMDVQMQLEWLARNEPEYLLTYPSLMRELARHSLAAGVRLPRLRQVRSLGESVDPEDRQLSLEAWNAPLVDLYSAEEVGYIALQCPKHPHYHVQAESVLVEVLDDSGRACAPGEVGRVVVTDLHNFAMPLIRYEIGDYAEVGEPCPCGRGLPVLRRILGRVRNMLVTADGKRYWPALGSRRLSHIPQIVQYQGVQKSLDVVEMHLVVRGPLGHEVEEQVLNHVLSQLPSGFSVRIVYRDQLPRAAGGKYEDFVSQVASGVAR